jgi:membrane fusion protein, multidrug efflux system
MKMKKVYALTGAFALLATVVQVAIVASESKKGDSDSVEGATKEATFPVTVTEARLMDMRGYIELNGLIQADNTVEIYPEINGRYARQRARLGDRVNKGDIIADVDPSKPGAPYAMSAIRAPISGTVTALTRRVGSTVTTETMVAKIGDIDHLTARLQIPEREIANLRIGLPAVVTVEAYPGIPFPAKVCRISPLVDESSHTKEVFLAFDGDDRRVNAGMFAKVRLYTRVYPKCVSVPDDSIVTTFEKSFVFTLRDDRPASMREIEKGVSIDGYTAILKGVAAGERVVVEGASVLADGAAVREVGGTSNE